MTNDHKTNVAWPVVKSVKMSHLRIRVLKRDNIIDKRINKMPSLLYETFFFKSNFQPPASG